MLYPGSNLPAATSPALLGRSGRKNQKKVTRRRNRRRVTFFLYFTSSKGISYGRGVDQLQGCFEQSGEFRGVGLADDEVRRPMPACQAVQGGSEVGDQLCGH